MCNLHHEFSGQVALCVGIALVWLCKEFRWEDWLGWEVLQDEVRRLRENDSKNQVTHSIQLLVGVWVVRTLNVLCLFDVLHQFTVETVAVALALHEWLEQEPETLFDILESVNVLVRS